MRTVGDRAPVATASSSVDPLSASGGGSWPGAAAAITGDDGGSDADRCVPAPAPRGPPDDEATAWPEAAPPAAPPRPEDTEEVLMASDARDRRASSRRMRSSYDAACHTHHHHRLSSRSMFACVAQQVTVCSVV